jgi:Tfp pilus assembly protein PilX
MDDFPPRPTPAQSAELIRRQRGRNIALMVVLISLVVLFFGITVVKLGHMG